VVNQGEETRQPPLLWWSPSLGLVTLEDGVWWRCESGRVSLRHDGLPNELPTDAVFLAPVSRDRGRLVVLVDHVEVSGDQA